MNENPLNPNELETLRILWENGELKPGQIQAGFTWPIENATLRSVLLNLVDKGHLARRPVGKAFHYKARVPKATLLHSVARMLARVFAGGSHRELVAQLMETSDLKAADRQFIREAAGTPAPRKSRRTSK